MPLQDALDTYTYFISEADKLNLAYITLVRLTIMDIEIDGRLFCPTCVIPPSNT
jgi:hypothetical protein